MAGRLLACHQLARSIGNSGARTGQPPGMWRGIVSISVLQPGIEQIVRFPNSDRLAAGVINRAANCAHACGQIILLRLPCQASRTIWVLEALAGVQRAQDQVQLAHDQLEHANLVGQQVEDVRFDRFVAEV